MARTPSNHPSTDVAVLGPNPKFCVSVPVRAYHRERVHAQAEYLFLVR